MKQKITGGNIKTNWSFIVIIIVIILMLCMVWGSDINSSRFNKVYSLSNKPKRDRVIHEYKDTPKFSVKTRNKDKTFDHKDMLIEQADLQYYKTTSADPKTSFIFREQNINIPYRVNAGIGGETINNISNYDLDNYIYDEIFEPVRNTAGELIEIFDDMPEVNPNRNLRVELYDADSQNVHDTEVSKNVRKIFATINISNNVNSDSLVEDILNYAEFRDKSTNDIKKIKMVLEKILDRNATITNVGGAKEIELINAVWQESSSKAEPTKSNIRDMLLIQIADTFDENTRSVLCPTGFSTRISVALIVESPECFPKTKDLLNKEILETASFIRRELENESEYTKFSDEKQHEIFKKELYSKLEIDYKGMLSSEEIEELVSQWIDYL